jgi:hypothetical protein
LDAQADDLVEQSPAAEDPGFVGGDLKSGPDLAQLGCLIQYPDAEAGLAEGDGVAESADAPPIMTTSTPVSRAVIQVSPWMTMRTGLEPGRQGPVRQRRLRCEGQWWGLQ